MTTRHVVPETFAARLRRLRAEAGLTQQQLAAGAGLSVGAIRQWERGRREPTLAAARDLARALGITLDVLAGA